ncbi:MAG: glycerophosphodiester phosphodiesterase family protein [Planctomycetota bacterium]
MTLIRVSALVPLLALLTFTPLTAKNLGHRMGGDVYQPENTLYCYQKALAELQDSPEFHYVELDVQETKDGAIVVFHDTKTLKRLVPKSSENMAVLEPLLRVKKFGAIRIGDLTLAQVQRLTLAKNARIPTLKMVLEASIRWKLTKPMLIEIKSLRSDACRSALLSLVVPYRSRLKVDFLAFPAAFRSSFPDPLRWKCALRKHDFRVYTALKPKTAEFDLAAGTPPPAGVRFRTVVAETDFVISQSAGRTVEFPISLPDTRGSGFKLRVGIEHGYDDTGDKGVRFRLRGEPEKDLLREFSKAKGWRWFELPLESLSDLTLVVEDEDTKLSGRHPGNRGRVKVTLSYVGEE